MQAEQCCGSELKYFGSADPVATFCHLGSGSNFKTVNKSLTNPVSWFEAIVDNFVYIQWSNPIY